MKTIALILTVVLAGCNLAIAQSPYATRLPAELQTAQMDSLADVTWLQGTTPAIRVEPLLRGRPVAVDADTTVRMVIGPSATGTLYAARTNLAAVTNAYEIQWPTIGTNSSGQAWFYTLLFDREGKTYWSGSGALYIEETTSTASNGLAWIEYTTPNVGWANVVGDPADNAALVQYVEDHGGGSAEDSVARAGVVSNAADIATLTTGKLDAVDARMAQWLVWSDINTNYHALSGDRSIKLTNESFSAIMNEILQGENSSGTVIDLANTRDGTGYVSFFYIDAPIYIGKSKGGWSCTHIRGDGGPVVSPAPGYTGRMFVAGDDTYRQPGQTKISGFNFEAGDDQLSANTNAAIYLGDCSDVEISSIYFSGFAGPAISACRDLSASQLNNLSIHGNWIYSQRGQLPMIDIAMPDDEKLLLGANIQNNYFLNKRNAVVVVQGDGASHVAVHDNIFNRFYVGGGVGQTGVVFKAGTGHSVQGNAFMRYLRDSVPVAFLPASSNSFASTVAANAYGTSTTTNAVLIGENAHGVEVWGNSMPSAAVNQVGDNTGGFVLNLGSLAALTISPAGNVGLNVDEPEAQLDVGGNVLVRSNLVVRSNMIQIGVDESGNAGRIRVYNGPEDRFDEFGQLEENTFAFGPVDGPLYGFSMDGEFGGNVTSPWYAIGGYANGVVFGNSAEGTNSASIKVSVNPPGFIFNVNGVIWTNTP